MTLKSHAWKPLVYLCASLCAVANGRPAIHLRQPTDTRKGQMWRDVGLGDWLFEIESATGRPRRLRSQKRKRSAPSGAAR